MCVFEWKIGHISEMVRDGANVTINHVQEAANTYSDEMKIINFL